MAPPSIRADAFVSEHSCRAGTGGTADPRCSAMRATVDQTVSGRAQGASWPPASGDELDSHGLAGRQARRCDHDRLRPLSDTIGNVEGQLLHARIPGLGIS